jgi:hypothetical protein
VIRFVSVLRQVGGVLRFLRFPPTDKTDRHDITEILLKVALNTINQPKHICIYLLTILENIVMVDDFIFGKEGFTKSSNNIAATALYPEDIVL